VNFEPVFLCDGLPFKVPINLALFGLKTLHNDFVVVTARGLQSLTQVGTTLGVIFQLLLNQPEQFVAVLVLDLLGQCVFPGVAGGAQPFVIVLLRDTIVFEMDVFEVFTLDSLLLQVLGVLTLENVLVLDFRQAIAASAVDHLGHLVLVVCVV
jgi:hypothetical protein